MTINYTRVLLWIILFQLVGYLFGVVTQHDIITWYPTLHKSSLTPPAIVFPIVWFILYCMLAIVGYILWQNRIDPTTILSLKIYTIQMLFNWLWSPLFFYFHYVTLSFVCIIIMLTLTLITIILTRKLYKSIVIMLLPYVLWLLFAGYLNAYIVVNN